MEDTESAPSLLTIEIDNGRFNIDKDKALFIEQNSKVRFVACSKLNSKYIPFLISDTKKKVQSRRNSESAITKRICLGKEQFNTKFRILPGQIQNDGYWIAEHTFNYLGPISIQMIFCTETENSYQIQQFGEQQYIIVQPKNFSMNNLIIMSVLPRCIGSFDKWKQFFDKQSSLGYNSFHLPPVQQLGMSRSYYSISNQLQLSPQTFQMADKYQALDRFVKQFNKNGVTFFVDIVLNHTSNTSDWIKDDPDAIFTVSNTPVLASTLLVDCAIFDWGEKIKKGQLQGYNKNIIQNQDDLNVLKQSLIKTLSQLNVWQYFQIKQDIIEEMFKLVKPSVPSSNIFIEDPAVEIQKIMEKNISNLGTTRYGVNIINLDNDWVDSNIKYEKNDLVIARNAINKIWKDKVQGWIYHDIPDSIIQQMRYNYVISKQNFCQYSPIVKRAFSLINEDKNIYALNNGWVGGYTTSSQDMITSKEFYFLRRKVNIWGDLVKLRYGNSKEDSPKLWNHMTEYVQLMARYFNGFRIDNCHNTPLHVGKYFIEKARNVNHSLIVFAELFTNSKQQDNVYIKRVGINALVKEIIHSLSAEGFVYTFYNNSGVNSIPLGSLGGRFIKDGQTRTFVKPRRPQYLTYQLTHDNQTYVEKGIDYKQLPIMVLLTFIGAPIGTNKGFDQYYPHYLHVTQTKQLYQQDRGCQQKIFKVSKTKVTITYSDKVLKSDSKVEVAGSWNNWKPIQMLFNGRYYYINIEVEGGPHLYKFIVDGNWVSQLNRPEADSNGNHAIEIAYQSTRRTSYSNLQGVRSSLSILKDKYKQYNQIYVKQQYGTIQIIRQNQTSKRRYSFIIGNLSDKNEFGTYKLIGSITSATIWVRNNGKIIQSSALKEYFDITSQDNNTILISGQLPRGFSCVIETEIGVEQVKAIDRLQQILQKGYKFNTQLHTFDVSKLMFTSQRQEEAISGYANYYVQNQGLLPYGGLGSLYNIMQQSIRTNNLQIPLYSNIIAGDWLFDYILKRLEGQSQFKQLYQNMYETFSLLKIIPRHQIPYFFSNYIINIVNSLRKTIEYGSLKLQKTSFSNNLALASFQFFSNIPGPKQDYKAAMSAGLPHFTIGWTRSWGRDTFMSIQLLLLHPQQCRQNILMFAKNLRHGLIPNLLDSGNNPRYNCRDASWWFIRAVKQYAQHTGNYNIFKEKVEMSFLDSDIDIDASLKAKNQKSIKSIQQIIQSIFQSHADGIEFRQWKAGIQIDSSMVSQGFNIKLGVDPDTGFIVGGNGRNCLTWMDKMGNRGKTKGVPATSRNGAPIEMVGLLYHDLVSYDNLNKQGYYSFSEVNFQNKSFKYSQWAGYIKIHFEEWFWIPVDLEQNTHPSIQKQFIKRRGIYKDVVKSCNLPEQEYRLRPNALITLALSPSLVNPQHAQLYLQNVQNNLLKPDSIGVGTLDKIHESLYSDEYDNDLDSPEFKKAFGFSYHNGPQWIWLYGFYIKALLNFKQITKQQAFSLLQDHRAYIRKDIWMSLPQLTNVNGKYNRFSCNAQAWSISSILLAISSIQKKQ